MLRRSLPLAALALSGCSMTLPIRGQVDQGGETFSGTTRVSWDGAGELQVISSKNATCNGPFVHITAHAGQGTFNCSDGRQGQFTFVSTGRRGTGSGHLSGEPVTFTFGGL